MFFFLYLGNNFPVRNAAGEEAKPDRAGKDKDIPEQQAAATVDSATGIKHTLCCIQCS